MYQNTDLASTQLKDWNICNFISFKVSCSGGTGHNFEWRWPENREQSNRLLNSPLGEPPSYSSVCDLWIAEVDAHFRGRLLR